MCQLKKYLLDLCHLQPRCVTADHFICIVKLNEYILYNSNNKKGFIVKKNNSHYQMPLSSKLNIFKINYIKLV